MSIKDAITKKGLELIQDPRVMRLMQDERVVGALMKTMEARNQFQDRLDDRVTAVAKSLGVATKAEVRELKRALKKMERELAKQKPKDTEGSSKK